MQLQYGNAPITYTNGIPTYKAGEWEGILPCKFHSYKRVIRPLDQGIIFNKNQTFYPRQKVLMPLHSPEYVYKPSFKLTKNEFLHDIKPKGIKYIKFETEPRKFMVEKKHYFPYKEELKKNEIEKNKLMNNDKFIKKEMKMLIVENGFSKKKYENFNNKHFIRFGFIKDQLDNIIYNDDLETEKTLKQIKEERIKNKLIQNNNLKRDISYVENLDNWEKNKIVNLKKSLSQNNVLPNQNNVLPIINNQNIIIENTQKIDKKKK